jgi:hypothetical protein
LVIVKLWTLPRHHQPDDSHCVEALLSALLRAELRAVASSRALTLAPAE